MGRTAGIGHKPRRCDCNYLRRNRSIRVGARRCGQHGGRAGLGAKPGALSEFRIDHTGDDPVRAVSLGPNLVRVLQFIHRQWFSP